jgi:hypothetical protein
MEINMLLPQMLEVAAGLILMYYVLGAVVSLVTQTVMESRQTRGMTLEAHLRMLAGDLTGELTSLPQIKALRPIRYAHWWDVLGAGTRPKKVEKVPAETLVDAFFDLAGLSSKGSLDASELTSLVSKLPDSDGKQALLRWINQDVTAISELRSRTSAYFTGVLNQAALAFRAKARSLVILTSIVVTLLCGADSLQFARELWTEAGGPGSIARASPPISSQPEVTAAASAVFDYIGALALRLGWSSARILPMPASLVDWLSYVAMKLTGLGITAAAVAQGSSFWYDLLRKLTGSTSVEARPAAEGDPVG